MAFQEELKELNQRCNLSSTSNKFKDSPIPIDNLEHILREILNLKLKLDEFENYEIGDKDAETLSNDPYDLDILMSKKGIELDQTLESMRKESLLNAAIKLQTKLPTQGRCPTCTLKLPCKHFSSMADVSSKNKAISRGDSHTPIVSHSFTIDTPKSSIMLLNYTPEPKDFHVRYRRVHGNYSEVSHYPRNNFSDREYQKLKVLEKIERYREDKLRKEIETIEELKLKEEQELERQRKMEDKQRLYFEKQKQRIREYQDNMVRPRESIMQKVHQIANQHKKKEEIRKKYVETQVKII